MTAALNAQTAVRTKRDAQVCAVHLLFDNHFSGQEFTDLCRLEHFVFTRRASAEPKQMGRVRKFVE